MRIERLNDSIVAIGPLDLLSCELLQQIRVSAEPGNSRAVRERLFPSPTKDKRSELRQEWKEYVERNALKEDFLTGADFTKFLEKDDAYHRALMKEAGFAK